MFAAGRGETITSSRLPASINLRVRCRGVKRFDLGNKATLIPRLAIETASLSASPMERYRERCSRGRETMFSSVRSLSNNRERTFSRVKIVGSGNRGKRYYARGTGYIPRYPRRLVSSLPACPEVRNESFCYADCVEKFIQRSQARPVYFPPPRDSTNPRDSLETEYEHTHTLGTSSRFPPSDISPWVPSDR